MGGVEVAALPSVDVQSPVCPALSKMVIISAFSVHHLSYLVGMNSADGLLNVWVIKAVLQQHTMAVGFLCGVNEGPEVFHGRGGGDFHSHVFACMHCLQGDGRVALPVAADINEVYVGGVAEGVIGSGAVGDERGAFVLMQKFQCSFHGSWGEVTESSDAGLIQKCQQAQCG
jgi:hypothetical protein